MTLQMKPDITIFTVGAHLKDMGDIHSVWEKLDVIVRKLKEKLPGTCTVPTYLPIPIYLPTHRLHHVDTTLVYKSQAPGHPDCMKKIGSDPMGSYPRRSVSLATRHIMQSIMDGWIDG